MQADNLIQGVFKAFKGLKWRDCEKDSRIQWYYAEDNCYVVRDTQTSAYWFINAKSPINACDNVLTKLERSQHEERKV